MWIKEARLVNRIPGVETGRGGDCLVSDTRLPEGRSVTARLAFGFEHGEMGGQARNNHGHWQMEKLAIFRIKTTRTDHLMFSIEHNR